MSQGFAKFAFLETLYGFDLNPFHISGLFLYPLKTLENVWFNLWFSVFLIFSGGIERDQCYKLG